MSNEHQTPENGSENSAPMNTPEAAPAQPAAEAPATPAPEAAPEQPAAEAPAAPAPEAAPEQPAAEAPAAPAPEAAPEQPAAEAPAAPAPEAAPEQPAAEAPAAPADAMSASSEASPEGVKYAGFWIRFVAAMIDGLLLGVVCWVLTTVTGIEFMQTTMVDGTADVNFGPAGMLVIILYYTLTTGSNMQGSLGKVALGLRVMRPDGAKITYPRALGRYFATILSALTLMIGYIMAGLMKEKKSLHDIVADTRVVYKKSMQS